MKWIAILATAAALVGCAAPTPYTAIPSYEPQKSEYASRAEAANVRSSLAERRKSLSEAKVSDDIERLNKEIAALETRLAALEDSIAGQASATPRTTTSTYSSSGTGTVYTGPRGGRYTITPSGNKSYVRRK